MTKSQKTKLTRQAKLPGGALDPVLDRVVHALVSKVIANRDRPPGSIHELGYALEMYGRTPLADSPAPLGEDFRSSVRPPNPQKSKKIVRRPADLKLEWQLAQQDSGSEAVIDRGVAEQLVPPDYWPVIAAVIKDGPDLAKRRFEKALLVKAQQRIAPKKGRPQGGKIAYGSLKGYASFFARLCRDAAALKNHPSGLLAHWEPWVEPLQVPDNPRTPSTLANPSPADLRVGYQELHATVLRKLKCKPGEELAVVQTAPRLYGVFRDLRAWAYFTLMAVTGSRPDALIRLRRENFSANHLTACGVGPTLLLETLKGHADEEFSNKALGGAAYPLEVLLAYLDRDDVLGPGLPGSYPLFPMDPTLDDEGWGYSGVYAWCAGGVTNCQQALIPLDRPAGPRPKKGAGRDWCTGHAPHRYRATGSQTLESRATRRYIDARNLDVIERLLSEILLDHKLSVEDRYKVGGKPGMERYAGIAVEINWLAMTTDLGARMVPPADRYGQLLGLRRGLEAEKRKNDQAFDKLFERSNSGKQSTHQIQMEALELQRASTRITEELLRVENEIEKIKALDPVTFVALPDDAPESAEHVDLEAIERKVLGRAAGLFRRDREPVRVWITPKEFSGVADGKSPKQIGKWISPDPDRRVIPPGTSVFLTSEPPVEECAERRRKIGVEAINPEWLDEQPRRRQLLNEIVCDWPAEANWEPYRSHEINLPAHIQAELAEVLELEGALAAAA